MVERLGIAGGGAIAVGLARLRPGAVVWVRADAGAERARAALDGAGATVTTDLAALEDATVVVEAIAEDRAAKAALLRAVPLADGALLATTTSSLPVAGLARDAGRPDRFFGLHLFNPVPRMELVELCFPDTAGDAVRARAHALCDALGKTAVEVPDLPGFVVNRLLFPYLFAAVRLQDETGLPAAAVDACMTLGARHPMGPLALLDLVGLDVAVAIGDAIGADVPDRLRTLVADGALGRKSGRGLTL